MDPEATASAIPSVPPVPLVPPVLSVPSVPPAPSWPILSAVEARVLGALIEKELTTPDYYPLTLNALVAACNQKNNRDPVLQLDETTVLGATDTLREKKLMWLVTLSGSRVAKYRHAFLDVYHVPDASVALLAELLLRGPQTAAELRARAERMHPYADTAAMEALLQELATHREGPFAVKLAREPGRREARFAHLLGGPVAGVEAAAGAASEVLSSRTRGGVDLERLEQLEQRVLELQERVLTLETKLGQVL
ncbi:MAG: YceH family protein [bacterium]